MKIFYKIRNFIKKICRKRDFVYCTFESRDGKIFDQFGIPKELQDGVNVKYFRDEFLMQKVCEYSIFIYHGKNWDYKFTDMDGKIVYLR